MKTRKRERKIPPQERKKKYNKKYNTNNIYEKKNIKTNKQK